MYVAIYSVYCTVNMVACNYASDWYMLYPPVALHGTRAQGFACLAIRHISFLGMVSYMQVGLIIALRVESNDDLKLHCAQRSV